MVSAIQAPLISTLSICARDTLPPAKRQQNQCGTAKAEPEKGKNRHPGDAFAGENPAAGGDKCDHNEEEIGLPLRIH